MYPFMLADKKPGLAGEALYMLVYRAILGYIDHQKGPNDHHLVPRCRYRGCRMIWCSHGVCDSMMRNSNSEGVRKFMFCELVKDERSKAYPAFVVTYKRK